MSVGVMRVSRVKEVGEGEELEGEAGGLGPPWAVCFIGGEEMPVVR